MSRHRPRCSPARFVKSGLTRSARDADDRKRTQHTPFAPVDSPRPRDVSSFSQPVPRADEPSPRKDATRSSVPGEEPLLPARQGPGVCLRPSCAMRLLRGTTVGSYRTAHNRDSSTRSARVHQRRTNYVCGRPAGTTTPVSWEPLYSARAPPFTFRRACAPSVATSCAHRTLVPVLTMRPR